MEQKGSVNSNANFRIKMLLLAVIFLVPIGYAVYLKLTGWRPTETTNYGNLVVPAIPLKDVKLTTMGGKEASLRDFEHHWLLVTFGKAPCRDACEQNIYKMRQTHIAQGKYQMRIRRLLVLTGDPAAVTKDRFKDYPGMVVVTGPVQGVRDLGRQFVTPDGTALDGRDHIYLVDPLGNLMMSYDADADANGIRKDLGRLLRVSRIG
jgi:cytochrome oxidase Cu insertion factor (SCO1/SenC/PrrC family)